MASRDNKSEEILKTKPNLHVDVPNPFGPNVTEHGSEENASQPAKPAKLTDAVSALAETFEDTDSLLIFTRGVDIPTARDTLRDKRFQLRFCQFFMGSSIKSFKLVSFSSLGYTAFQTNYSADILTTSGISFYVFINLVSIVN
jgi:hypothetical protein